MLRKDIEKYVKDALKIEFEYKNIAFNDFFLDCNLNKNFEKAYGTITIGTNSGRIITGVENIKIKGK